MTVIDLWGNEDDPFVSARERYGVWPTTVWPVNHQDAAAAKLKTAIGDSGEARDECFTKTTEDQSTYRGKVTESIFPPQVALWALNCWAPDSGVVLDPFAGGGTRALLTASRGLTYLGVELRAKEVAALEQRIQTNHQTTFAYIYEGDARDLRGVVGTAEADFLITCPPYWNLEKYDGGPNDLSMAPTYDVFLEGMSQVVAECYRALKPGAFAVWVTGLLRDTKGTLLPLHHDVARLHSEARFQLKEEVVLKQEGNGAIQRVGNFDKGQRHLIRVHEYLQVFVR